jgi:mycothiol synthase
VVTCALGSLVKGGSASVTMVVTPLVAGSLTNAAVVTGSMPDPVPANNQDQVTTTVNPATADLSVTEMDSPDPVFLGGTLTYTLTVGNDGPGSAAKVSVQDPLPSATAFESVDYPLSWSCSAPAVGASGTVTCTKASMAPNSNATLTIRVKVDPSASADSTLANSATVGSQTLDPNTANNSAQAATGLLPMGADLSVHESAFPHAVKAGAQLTYRIRVRNAGPETAQEVVMKDRLPGMIRFMEVHAGGWSCTTPAAGETGMVRCTKGSLAPGAVSTIVVVASQGRAPRGGRAPRDEHGHGEVADHRPEHRQQLGLGQGPGQASRIGRAERHTGPGSGSRGPARCPANERGKMSRQVPSRPATRENFMSGGPAFPSGLASRSATVDDVDAVTELVAASDLQDDGVVEIDRDDVAADFINPVVDLDRDTLLVFDSTALVACALIEPDRGTVWADVHPGHRGLGIGSAVLAWTEARAREAGCTAVRQGKSDANAGAADLFRRNGYAPTWTSWLLELRMGDQEPPEPTVPEGIGIREFTPGIDDRQVHRLIDDAFTWEGRFPQPYEQWASFTIDRETFAPKLSSVALDSDEIVGALIFLDYGSEEEGHVHQLAVKKSHRNRGIGRALLQQAFRRLHQTGRRVCTVATDSRTGALALYERVGMRIRRSYTNYMKKLGPEDP